jgi:hypothetical protein
VNITGFGFIQKDGVRQIIFNPYLLELPYKLNERRKCVGYYTVRWFQENDKVNDITEVFFEDETGNTWKAKITKKLRRNWIDWEIEGVRIEWSPSLQTYYREDTTNGDIDYLNKDKSK